jgi:hypothetical protein
MQIGPRGVGKSALEICTDSRIKSAALQALVGTLRGERLRHDA